MGASLRLLLLNPRCPSAALRTIHLRSDAGSCYCFNCLLSERRGRFQPFRITFNMGKEGLRYAAKVSLDKPAAEQECLHVCLPRLMRLMEAKFSITRTAGILIVRH
jgi:hypothetical protein